MDIAALGYDIDSSQARSAASNLLDMNRAAAQAEAGAAKLQTVFRNANGTFKSAASYAKEHEESIRALAAEFNSTLSKQLQFADAQKRLAEAIRLGVVPAENAQVALEHLQRQYSDTAFQAAVSAAKIQRSNNQIGDTSDIENASSGGDDFANSLTNVSFQVQDFAVQVASGQEAIIAFAQQFPQLTSSLGFGGKVGLYGAVIGTAAAIGVSLYQAFSSAGEEAKSLDDTVGDMDESFSNLSTYLKISAEDTAVLSEKFGMFAGQIRGFNEYMAGIAIAESLERSGAVIDSLRVNLDAVATAFANVQSAQAALDSAEGGGIATPNQIELAREALAGYQSDLDDAASSIGLSADEALRLRDALNQVKAGRTMQEQAVAAAEALKYIQSIYPNAQQLPAALRPTYTELSNIASKAAEANENIKDMRNLFTLATSAASSLSGAVAGIAGAAQRAGNSIATMAQRLWDAAQAKATFNGVDAGGLAAQYAMYGQGRVTGERLGRESGALYGGNSVLGGGSGRGGSGGGGGGGGGGTDPYADNLQRLIESLQTEQQTVDEWYQENLTILEDRRASEILGEQAHKDALLALEQEYLERKKGLNEGYNQFSLDSASALFGEMYSLTGSSLSGLLKLQKTFGAASALVNTYTAAAQVLADPSLGFFAKFAAVAKTVAAGIGLVNAINGGGGGGAGRAGGTTSATSATASEPNRVTRVELVGDDWLVKLAESMMTQIYDASRDGRVIVARG